MELTNNMDDVLISYMEDMRNFAREEKGAAPVNLANNITDMYNKSVMEAVRESPAYQNQVNKAAEMQIANLQAGRQSGMSGMAMANPNTIPNSVNAGSMTGTMAPTVAPKPMMASTGDIFEDALTEYLDYAAPPMPPKPNPVMPQQAAVPPGAAGVPPGSPMPGPIGPNGMPVNMPVPPQPNPGMGMVPPVPQPAAGMPVQITPAATIMDPDGSGGQTPMIDPDGPQGPQAPMPVQEKDGKYMIDPDGNGPQSAIPVNIPANGSNNAPKQVALNSPDGKDMIDNKQGSDKPASGIGIDGKPSDNPAFAGMTKEKMEILKKKLSEMGGEITEDGKVIFNKMPKELSNRLLSAAGVPKEEFDKANKELAKEDDDPDDTTSTTSKAGGISKTPGLPGMKRKVSRDKINEILASNNAYAGSAEADSQAPDSGELAMNASEPLSSMIFRDYLSC